MEIQLSLDTNGRTTWAKPQQLEASVNGTIKDQRGKTNGESSGAPLQAAAAGVIDFSSKTCMTSLVLPCSEESSQEKEWMDNILFDCEISDCGLMPRTFWMDATSKPRCALEQMALDVFHHHVPTSTLEHCDPTTSGAEWWVQIRPSPETTGRYSMHDPPSQDHDDMAATGISFHWDKDEDLRLLAGGSLYVHPYLSTVTYLTNLGAPTMVVNCRVNTVSGEWMLPSKENEVVESLVSWPLQGKHLCFDGQFLHAAPSNLMEDGVFEQQCKIKRVKEMLPSNDDDPKEAQRQDKILDRRHRRVTFLVNIWLNYKPFNVEPFPDTMIDKLTGVDESNWNGMFSNACSSDTSEVVDEKCIIVCNGKVQDEAMELDDDDNKQMQQFTWPMGDCDSGETIEMQMPLTAVRSVAATGGNCRINWAQSTDSSTSVGVRLCKDAKQPATATGDANAKEKSGEEEPIAVSEAASEDEESRAKRLKTNHNVK